MIDTEAESESNPKATLWVGLLLGGLLIAPPILAWFLDDPAWLFGWLLLLILGLAG